MNLRSDWLEGLLWAEEYVKGEPISEDKDNIDWCRWEILYSGTFDQDYDKEFIIGSLDYLDNIETRLGENNV